MPAVLKVFTAFAFLLILPVILMAQYHAGGIVRGDTSKKEIALVFTGHEYADGHKIIIKSQRKNETPAAFFFTEDFYRNYPKSSENSRKTAIISIHTLTSTCFITAGKIGTAYWLLNNNL